MDFTAADKDTCSSVNMAAYVGNVDQLQSLFKTGKSPNIPDNRGWVAIHFAIDGRHVDALRLILERDDVNVNVETYDRSSPLLLALCKRIYTHHDVHLYEIVKLLLEFGADPNINSQNPYITPLSKAVNLGNVGLVKLLLDHGARVCDGDDHYISPIHAAASVGTHGVEILNLLLSSNQYVAHCSSIICKPITPLHSLLSGIYHVDLAFLRRMLLIPGISAILNNVDGEGNTALALACNQRSMDAVEILLDYGADPNIRNHSNNIPFIILLNTCSEYNISMGLRTAKRLFDATCISEIKKSKFIDQMFYDYLIISKRSNILKSALYWYPCLKEIRCRFRCLLHLYFGNASLYHQYENMAKHTDNVSLLGTACLACTDEEGLAIVEILLEFGCSVNGEQNLVPPMMLAFVNRSPETEKYTSLAVRRLIDLGANPDFLISRQLSRSFFWAIDYHTVANTMEILFSEIDEASLSENFWKFYRCEMHNFRNHTNTIPELFFALVLSLDKYLTKLPSRFSSLIFTNFGTHSEQYMKWRSITESPKRLSSLSVLKVRQVLFQKKTEFISMSQLTNKLCEELQLPVIIKQILCLERT